MKRNRIFLTFDVEEWTVPLDYGVNSVFNNNTKFSRDGCNRILEILEKYNIKSTFFVTGKFAISEKKITHSIIEHGHEVACHGYIHKNLRELSIIEIKTQLKKATKILEKITKEKIIGFRAPYYSIDKKTLDILYTLGYEYDSSFHPTLFNSSFYQSQIKEIPISTFSIFKLPMSWRWFRNFGVKWITFATKNILKRKDIILVFHTWEFVDLPYIKGIPLSIIRNTGDNFLKQLEKFIINFSNIKFGRLKEYGKK